MATVKTKFRQSGVSGRPGTVYYQLYHRHKTAQISAGIRIAQASWEEIEGSISGSLRDNGTPPDGTLRLYRLIESGRMRLVRIISSLDGRGQEYSITDIIGAYRSAESGISLQAYMSGCIRELEEKGRFGTALTYRRTRNSISGFLGGRELLLSEIDENIILDYSDYLSSRQLTKNTRSFYMRTLRSVYNKASRQGLVRQTFPFRDVYTGIDKTRKRAVSESAVLRMQRLDLSRLPSLVLCRDLFVFSYCTRGMAFVDIAFLKRENIKGGYISYCRHKTRQRLRIKIEPCIQNILRRYASGERSYVFPILGSGSEAELYSQYRRALGIYNRRLKRLGRLAGEMLPLSSYTPRHSWATAAYKRRVPVSVISAAMGHTSEKTTRIYLASLEDSVIDEANSSLLKTLNTVSK